MNNESSEIIRIINSGFNEFAKNPDLDLYPEELRTKIDEVNKWVYPTINNGVYKYVLDPILSKDRSTRDRLCVRIGVQQVDGDVRCWHSVW